jgi:site-specific DNA-methyltransferase (adenine-specific)
VRHPAVLDPFMGTGTTLLAAALEGGHGIELDPSYLAIARHRLASMQDELVPGAPP